MEAYLFVYSRLERFDYRLIYAPSQSFLPNPARDEFVSFAREVINTDNISNGGINATRYSLIRRDHNVLFGIGIYNKSLGDCSSNFETRNIRGFFGVVFKYETGTLPKECFMLPYFQNLYSTYFMPLWHAVKKDENKINSIIQRIDIYIDNKRQLTSPLALNTSSTICKVLPESIVISESINSALLIPDIELVLGLNDIKHVTSAHLLQFRNVSIIGNTTEENIPISQSTLIENPFKRKEMAKTTSEKHKVQGKTKNDKFLSSKTKSEDSNIENKANYIYSICKKCGINVKLLVKYLAKKCGFYISEQPIENSINQPCEYLQNQDMHTLNSLENSHSEPTSDTIDTEKKARQTYFAEIRQKIYSTNDTYKGQQSKAMSLDTSISLNNIEELKKLPNESKDNFDIEDLK